MKDTFLFEIPMWGGHSFSEGLVPRAARSTMQEQLGVSVETTPASENSVPPSQSTQRLTAGESEGLAILAQCRPTLKGRSSSRAPGGAWSS